LATVPSSIFQQGLLNTFARHVASNTDVLTGLANLIDFVDEDNPALSGFDIEISRMQQLEQQVLDVFTDVTGFGQSCRIADGKWHLQRLGQSLGQQRLARSCRSDQKNVGFFNLNVFCPTSRLCISRL
jgi:hypothetical protein